MGNTASEAAARASDAIEVSLAPSAAGAHTSIPLAGASTTQQAPASLDGELGYMASYAGLQTDHRVVICNLVWKPELNGALGTLRKYDK